MSVLVRTLESIDDVRGLEALLRDYIRFVCDDLMRASGVSFDADALLANTLGSLEKVVPPNGFTFVAEGADGTRLGMAFLRPSGPDAMEIKRLYVPPVGRGRGVGRALVEAAIARSRQVGAKELRLDTTRNLEAAIALYRSYGFEDCAPYPESDHYEDPVLGPYLVFMAKQL